MRNLSNKLSAIFLIGLFCLTGTAFAATPIELGGKEILPAKKTTVLLSELEPETYYNITCNITNPSSSTIVMVVDSDRYPGFNWKYLNGQYLPHQGSLNPGQNTLLIKKVSKMKLRTGKYQAQNIVLSNADQDVSIIVESCIATPIYPDHI